MSEEALIASIELECSMLKARGVEHLLVTPGNYGRDFAADELGLDLEDCVQCSNYIGATVDMAVAMGFSSVLVVGHIGKLVKVAAGVMNTHSRVADARLETIAAHAAVAGANAQLACALMDAPTTDAALDLLDDAGLLEPVMQSIMERVGYHLRHRVRDAIEIEAIMFSKVRGMLGVTGARAERLAALHTKGDESR